jgi:hypothetical protein
MSVITSILERATTASVVRHFALTFVAVFALQSITVLQSVGNALVAGSPLAPAGDMKALYVAAMYAAGTAILRVAVPALASLAKTVTTA